MTMLKPMTCMEAAKACGGTFFGTKEEGERLIKGVSDDSRKIEEGWLFVALLGERSDGHSFIPQVFEKKAACVVSMRKLEDAQGPYILVENTYRAMQDIAAYYRSILNCKIVGITGSVGKTSTKEIIAAVLSEKYRTQKTEKNFNNELGVPRTLFTIEEEHEAAVVEMGISEFGEMDRLGKMVKPDIMVITNIGQSHLESLKTRDGILQAKTEVFAHMGRDSIAVLNGGDDKLVTISSVQGNAPCFFAKTKEEAEPGIQLGVYASDIKGLGLHGSDCMIHIGDKSVSVHVPIPGEHMVLNAVSAAAVGNILGLSPEEIAKGLSKAQAMEGRGKLIETGTYTLIDECYNANPASMKAAIDLLCYADTRKAAVLGDMLNLGENSPALHKEIGTYAAEKEIDALVFIGEMAKYMYEGAKEAGAKKLYYFETKEDFLKEVHAILKPQDAVLLKASHGMAFEVILEQLAKLQ